MSYHEGCGFHLTIKAPAVDTAVNRRIGKSVGTELECCPVRINSISCVLHKNCVQLGQR